MMQAADFWSGDDSSGAVMLNRAVVGAILVERQMRAGASVVVDVRGQDPTQMALVEDYDVVQTLAADRTDHSSPWIRGAPQSGLATLICRIRSRTSRSTEGRPDLERQRQNNLNP